MYDFKSMILWKKQNYGNSLKKKVSGCQGLVGGKGWVGSAQRIFRAVKLLCMIP